MPQLTRSHSLNFIKYSTCEKYKLSTRSIADYATAHAESLTIYKTLVHLLSLPVAPPNLGCCAVTLSALLGALPRRGGHGCGRVGTGVGHLSLAPGDRDRSDVPDRRILEPPLI